MSLLKMRLDKKAERVCYPFIHIDDGPDSSIQPSRGSPNATSDPVERGSSGSGQLLDWQAKAMSDRLQHSIRIYGPGQKPTPPSGDGGFIRCHIRTCRFRKDTFYAFCIIPLVWNEEVRKLMVDPIAGFTVQTPNDKLRTIAAAHEPNPSSAPDNDQRPSTTRTGYNFLALNEKRRTLTPSQTTNILIY